MKIKEFVELKQNANTLDEIGKAMDLVISHPTLSEKVRNRYYDQLDSKYSKKLLEEE